MSTVAVARVLTGLWPALRNLLLKIGRWLIETIAEEGIGGLIVYMRQRVRVFGRRIVRVKARRSRMKSKRGPRYKIENWRVLWLQGRVKRWRTAIAWLQSKAAERLRGYVIAKAVARAQDEIPEEAPDEDFSRWLRKARR